MVTEIATVEAFWADAAHHLAQPAPGPTHRITDVELVPPVLPGARVICIGLNYLKHIAEGSYAAEPIPEFPPCSPVGRCR